MNKRSLLLTLLASTSLTSHCLAQTAPAASGQASNIVINVNPPAPAPVLKQSGFTASPTDYQKAVNKNVATTATATDAAASATTTAGAAKTSIGGVTGQDVGGGHMIEEVAHKTRSTVTRDAIDKMNPTANPYQMIGLLPGVNQSSTDNTGLNGGNIIMRGFGGDHVGLTIEGMPVNDSGNYALYPQEYVDGENIGQISIAQGSPDLDSPHIGSTGGVINIYMRDPAEEAGGYASISLGSNNLVREFVRLESGRVGNVRAFLSYSNLDKNHWTGEGEDHRDHIDGKIVWDLSPGNSVSFSAIYNEARNNFYKTLKMSEFDAGQQPHYNNEPTSALDYNWYEYRVNPFKNLILSAPSSFTLNSNLKFDTIPYFWYGWGNGGGTATMNETSGTYWGRYKITGVDYNGDGDTNDKVLYYNPSNTLTHRPGVINKFTYEANDHKLVFGNWFEYAHHRQTGPYEALNADGTINDYFADSNNFTLPATATCTLSGAPVACPEGAMQKRDQLTTTYTNMIFVGDSWKATDALTLDFGVKQVWIDRTVENYMPGDPDPKKSLYDTATLPTLGARYELDKENKLFASYSTSFRSSQNYGLVEQYNASYGTITPAMLPDQERGKTVEIGHRFQGDWFATSISGFLGHYRDFQLYTTIPDPANPAGSTIRETVNVGDLVNYGINFEIGTRPINNFRPYVSAELLRTEMLDNLIAGKTAGGAAEYLPTKGNALPGAPAFSMAIGLDYDNGHLFGNLAYKHTGEQYATYMNDEKMDAYGRLNATLGYRFDDVGYVKKPEIQLNLSNLLDSRDLTGVSGITNAASTTAGVNGTNISGSAPTYYVGQGFSAMLTLKAGF